MLATVLVLLALGGAAAGCRYTPDANGHVLVPEGITSIGDLAFLGCTGLTTLLCDFVHRLPGPFL